MRVANVDGLVTLFYDGSKELLNRDLEYEHLIAQRHGRMNLNAMRRRDGHGTERTNDFETMDVSDECKRYFRERYSWQQIIVVEGVTAIPEFTFKGCINIKRVIFANTVIRIEQWAFSFCKNLVYIKLSITLEYIGEYSFTSCNLSSVFIPPRCRKICNHAFEGNTNLTIFHVPRDTELGSIVISDTALAEASPVGRFNHLSGPDRILALQAMIRAGNRTEQQRREENNEMNEWLKTMNNDEAFALHRVCASFRPLKEVIHAIIQEKGLKAFREENSAGITPSRYLQENPYTELNEKEIIREHLMKMMGEVEY
ncbi:hypothetical protein CTEN210_00261 [Chaetoceros tenuissimus]|uniref:Leucine-rich repeat domain-containing protein n=1 Tax=Chaetoceros tenuissimus TaxID=426638 RepID=A0AAD3GYT1_9STRA|nr:hypothetical protein CTEN210_00261 [Chaetoceros tenuissimus]